MKEQNINYKWMFARKVSFLRENKLKMLLVILRIIILFLAHKNKKNIMHYKNDIIIEM